jgi:hypothetical protein
MSKKRGSRLRWRIAYAMDRLKGQCGADLVSWALGWNVDQAKGRLPWRPIGEMCRRDAAECGTCYCGKIGQRRGAENIATASSGQVTS